MPVLSIWESSYPSEQVARGREVTDAIWQESCSRFVGATSTFGSPELHRRHGWNAEES
jgi:hypothetical protein